MTDRTDKAVWALLISAAIGGIIGWKDKKKVRLGSKQNKR